MKKIVLVLGILLMSISASNTAFAGTINTYEQDVMAAAQGTFDYKGTAYVLDSSYISQLRDYMMADDVDLTADQRNTVLQAINGYIETGVQQGYLKPVGGQPNSGDTNGNSGNTSSGSDQGIDTDQSGSDPSEPVNSGTNPATDDTGAGADITPTVNPTQNDGSQDNGDMNSGPTDNTGSAPQDDPNTQSSSLDDLLGGLFDGDTVKEDTPDSADQVTGTDNNIRADEEDASITASENEAAENSIIKNTGFDLSLTYAMVALLGVIMLAGICVTVRYHYFAKNDE